jgi:hypothetical protein
MEASVLSRESPHGGFTQVSLHQYYSQLQPNIAATEQSTVKRPLPTNGVPAAEGPAQKRTLQERYALPYPFFLFCWNYRWQKSLISLIPQISFVFAHTRCKFSMDSIIFFDINSMQ